MPIICNKETCNIRASFGYDKAIYCLSHKEEGMINIYKKYCNYPMCKIFPSYGNIGEKAQFCAKHKKENMIDLNVKRCNFKDCKLSAYFDIEGGKGKFCSKHKELNMIDIKHGKCIVDNCNKHPLYNYPRFPPKFCSNHKELTMINVKNKKCLLCDNIAKYGNPGNKIIYCSKHKEVGMIRRPNSKCIECKNPAIYGINFIPKYCNLHKKENTFNYLELNCKSCNLLSVLDINNLCEYCNPINFMKGRMLKQNNLMNYLDSFNLKGTSTDMIIDNGICGKERPDRVFECDLFILILECDEHQHNDRNDLCEYIRMVNISQSYGGMPVYFIRWNPDEYIPYDSNIEPESINNRYIVLKEYIEQIINNNIKLPSALLSVFYMYYDGWLSIDNEKWKVLINYESS